MNLFPSGLQQSCANSSADLERPRPCGDVPIAARSCRTWPRTSVLIAAGPHRGWLRTQPIDTAPIGSLPDRRAAIGPGRTGSLTATGPAHQGDTAPPGALPKLRPILSTPPDQLNGSPAQRAQSGCTVQMHMRGICNLHFTWADTALTRRRPDVQDGPERLRTLCTFTNGHAATVVNHRVGVSKRDKPSAAIYSRRLRTGFALYFMAAKPRRSVTSHQPAAYRHPRSNPQITLQ
jgi:hypothetical protein